MMNFVVLKGELTFFWGFAAVLKGDWTFFGGPTVMNCAALTGELTFFGGFTAPAGQPHAPGGLLGL